jgi:glycosyltransferase involved in cell wall biosynthesis
MLRTNLITKKHLAIMGTRGIPAAYGGFETFAEEISKRMLDKELKVTVYCRYYFFEKRPKLEIYQGVHLCYLPTFKQKFLDTPVHSLLSFIHALKCDYTDVLLCNAANSPFAWILKLKKLPVYINVDGIERKRSKWNSLGKLWYRLGEWASVKFATKVVADAEVIANYYREQYKISPAVIAYGAEPKIPTTGVTLEKFGLTENQFILYVSRLEPENNALCVIQAYLDVKSDLPLVIVGDAPYSAEYIAKLYATADSRVIFTGFQFGDAYRELRANCQIYIQATEVGGTHPALVEAMAYGNCIIANDVPEHREVLAEAGEYYEFNNSKDLSTKIQNLLKDQVQREVYSNLAKDRAREFYSWDSVTEAYFKLLFF